MVLEVANAGCCAFALPGKGVFSSASAPPEGKAALTAWPLLGLASSGAEVPVSLPAGVWADPCGLKKLLLVVFFSCPTKSEAGPRFVPLEKGLSPSLPLLSAAVSLFLAWNLMGVCLDLGAHGAGRLGVFSRVSGAGSCSSADSARSTGEAAGVESATCDVAGVEAAAAAAAAASAAGRIRAS